MRLRQLNHTGHRRLHTRSNCFHPARLDRPLTYWGCCCQGDPSWGAPSGWGLTVAACSCLWSTQSLAGLVSGLDSPEGCLRQGLPTSWPWDYSGTSLQPCTCFACVSWAPLRFRRGIWFTGTVRGGSRGPWSRNSAGGYLCRVSCQKQWTQSPSNGPHVVYARNVLLKTC